MGTKYYSLAAHSSCRAEGWLAVVNTGGSFASCTHSYHYTAAHAQATVENIYKFGENISF